MTEVITEVLEADVDRGIDFGDALSGGAEESVDAEGSTDGAGPLLARLKELARSFSPELRQRVAAVKGDFEAYFVDPERVVQEEIEGAWGETITDLSAFLDFFSVEELVLASQWPGEPFERPEGVDGILFTLERDVVAEVLRQKLLWEERRVDLQYWQLREEIAATLGVGGLEQLISQLEVRSLTLRQEGDREGGLSGSLDFPVSTSPGNTLLDRALRALRNDLDREEAGVNVDGLREQTRDFVLGILNPREAVAFWNITDVYGAESENPEDGGLDATRIRVKAHREEIERKYGVKIEAFDQGTSIACPEQCGFNALVALNQARRVNLDERIVPRFLVLNNAARLTEADGIEGGAEAAASSALLYFSLDLGDGVKHHGVAYGVHTLTLLRPYITELYELEGTDRGSQFRSLEFEQHIATLSAMAEGALPACYRAKVLDAREEVPSLNLLPNQAMLVGRDKFGNGVLATEAADWLDTVLDAGESHRKVGVRFYARNGEPYCGEEEEGTAPCDEREHEYEEYVLARTLGKLRGGECALWESSTPTTADPRHGYLSIGVFKAGRTDVNDDVINLNIGDIVEIAIGDDNVN